MTETRKVAIYVRVSTTSQAEEGYSIDEQKDKLSSFCKIKDWSIYNTYTDGGFTGSNTQRPALERLIKDAKKKLFDTVLVYKLDRLSRSQKDTLYLIEEIFIKNGIEFLSLQENFDTSTPFGKAMIGLLAVFAQLEREQIKERMQLGKLGRAKSGKSMMWTNPPFGYTFQKGDKIVKVNQVQAIIVERIFNEYISGKSLIRILNDLDNEGHVGRDKPWSLTTIKDILRNPTYYGKVRFRNEEYDGLHEPIISEETFKLAQAEIKKRQTDALTKYNNPRPFQSKYMLSGLMKCGYCGSSMRIHVAHKRLDGTYPPHKYQCANRYAKDKSKRCHSSQYFKNELEDYVMNELNRIKTDGQLVNYEKPKQINREAIQKEICLIEQKIDRLTNLYVDGLIERDQLKSKSDLLQNEKRLLEESLVVDDVAIFERQRSLILDELNGTDLLSGDYDQRCLMVRKIVRKVIVTKEVIKVILNF